MLSDAEFKDFISSWMGLRRPAQKDVLPFATVGSDLQRVLVHGVGVFVELGNDTGIFCNFERRGDCTTITLMSWPDSNGRQARFITKACCSNVIEIGTEVVECADERDRT